MKENKPLEKNLSLDLLRVIAILAVIMIHVSAQFVFASKGNSSQFIIGNIFDSISRCGVPLFVMISGALMLNEQKEITFKKIFKKILNTLLLLYLWSFVYTFTFNIASPIAHGQKIQLSLFFNEFLFGHYHLWFLFMIIGLYLITPILRTFVKKENSHIVLYFIILSLILKFSVPIFEILSIKFSSLKIIYEWFDMFQFDLIGTYVTYYITGWFIFNISIPKKFQNLIYILGIVGVLTTILTAQIFNKYYQLAYCDYSIFNFFYSVSIFMILTKNPKPKTKFGTKLAGLAKYSFGVYVLHVLIMTLFNIIFPNKSFVLLYIIIEWVITSIISFVLTYLIYKIPILKKCVKG